MAAKPQAPDFARFSRSLAGTPMAGEARGIYNAAIRGGINPAFVAGLAGAESSFGAKGYAVGTNNPFGLGVHLKWKFPNYAAATTRLASTLNESSYKNLYGSSGLAGVISRYTPASDGNNEAQHAANIRRYGSNSGGDPSRVYMSGGALVAGGSSGVPTAPSPGGMAAAAPQSGSMGLSLADQRRWRTLMDKTSADISRGISPGPEYGKALSAIAGRYLAPSGQPAVAAAVPDAGGAMPMSLSRGSTYGFSLGKVDSGLALRGGTGGDWGGSMERALSLAKSVGATPSSQKRTRQLTASGSNSDHWIGSPNSYATDLPTSGAAGDRLLAKVSQSLGVKLVAGSWNNVVIGGFKYNIGWRVPGHFDHIHIGVRR